MNLSKKQEYLIIAGLLVLIFPFFALLFYTHPQSDDYVFANMVPEYGIFGFVKYMYFNWTGRYFAMFLAAIDPWIYHSIQLYHLSLVIYFVFFIFSIYLLIRSINKEKITRNRSLIISLFSVFFFLQINPDLYEFLYWYPGVIGYQVAISLFILLLSSTFSFINDRITKRKYIWTTSLFSFLLIGTSELLIPFLFISYGYIIFFLKNIKESKKSLLLLMLIIFLGFSFLFLLAPGNYARLAVESGHYNTNVFFKSFLSTGMLFIFLIQKPVFVFSVIGIILIALERKNEIKKKYKIVNPYLLVFISLLIIYASFFFVNLILNASIIPSRVFSIISFFTIIIILINILNIIQYLKPVDNYYSNIYIYLFSGIIAVSLLGFSFKSFSKFITAKPNSKSNYIYFHSNLSNSIYTIVFEANNFLDSFHELDNKLKTGNKKGVETICIKPFPNYSKLLYRTEILSHEKEWLNCAMTKYYNLDSVYIQN